jgi:hypothetical protein
LVSSPEKKLPAPLAALPSTMDDQMAFFLWLRDYRKEIQSTDEARFDVMSPLQPSIEDWVTLSEIEGRYVARVLEHLDGFAKSWRATCEKQQ